MLFLIGVGLDTGDISVKGLDLIKSTEHVCIEQYTTKISREYLNYLKMESGKDILELSRSDLEERLNNTLLKAKSADLAILFLRRPAKV